MTGLRLSAGQESMWFVYRMAPESAAYNVSLALRIHTPLDVPALRRALEHVVDRHDLLRSVFVEVAGTPRRILREHRAACLDVREVADDARVDDMVRELGMAPFRLETEAPFRAALIRRGVDDAVLVLVTHHIISDRTSQWLLAQDLLDAYRGLLADGEPAWAGPAATYDDYVEAEHRLLDSPRRAELERLWTEVCSGAPTAELPADRRRPARQSFTGATCRRRFPADLSERVCGAAKDAGVTPFTFLLGTFESLLHRYSGRPEFLIGCPASTRSGRGMRGAVGYFVNSLVLRSEFTPQTTLREAVASAHQQMARGMAGVRYPFPLLPAVLDPVRSPNRAQLFQIAFTMVSANRLEPLLELMADEDTPYIDHCGLRLSLVDVPHMEGQLDLNVEMRQTATSLTAVFRYSTDLFDAATIDRVAGQFVLMVEAAVADPDARVSAVSLMDDTELRQLLQLGNSSAR